MAQHYLDENACYSDVTQISMIGGWILHNQTASSRHAHLENNPFINQFVSKNIGQVGSFEQMMSAYLPHLLATLILIVLISRILHSSLNFIKQPLIVCQLTAGILLYSLLPRESDESSTSSDRKHLNPANRRVEHIIGYVGVLFNLFIGGVKLDVTKVTEFGMNKPLIFGFASQLITFGVGTLYCVLLQNPIKSFAGINTKYLSYVLQPLSSTYPIILCEILMELDLLNSELGRLALSASMIQCLVGWTIILASMVVNQGHTHKSYGIYALICILVVIAIIVTIIRRYAQWIFRTTNFNARVRDVHILMITIIVLMLAFLDEMIGFPYPDAPVIMGLIVPHGPPLGTALIERLDLVASEVLLPFTFMLPGLYFDWVGFIKEVRVVLVVESFIGLTFIAKVCANIAAAKYCKMSIKEGFIIGLMMNFRGLLDVLGFLSLKAEGLGNIEFTALVFSTIAIPAICTPLVAYLYKPLCKKKETESLTVENMDSSELNLMVCFYDDKPLPVLIDFLNASCTDKDKSMCLHALYLVELQGCAASRLISHRNDEGFIDATQMNGIHNHFIALEQSKRGGVTIFPYTSFTPLKTMHQDVCSLVLKNNIPLVIVPYPRKHSLASLEDDISMRDLVPSVLQQASCSVGIMVYHGTTRIKARGEWRYHVGVLFWGGHDDCEALAIASRLAHHPDVYLSVVHFIEPDEIASEQQKDADSVHKSESEQQKDVVDNDKKILLSEKQRDGDIENQKECGQRRDAVSEKSAEDKAIEDLKILQELNEQVSVSEIVMDRIDHIFSVVHELGENHDLLIVGRNSDRLLKLDGTLEQWTESHELGLIGDTLATDNQCIANVLVVQQHKL